jgi:cold shock CspA family protein
MIGRITRLHPNGFGFISPTRSVDTYFFHSSELIDFVWGDSLKGQTVEFDPGENEKGLIATNVRPYENDSTPKHMA